MTRDQALRFLAALPDDAQLSAGGSRKWTLKARAKVLCAFDRALGEHGAMVRRLREQRERIARARTINDLREADEAAWADDPAPIDEYAYDCRQRCSFCHRIAHGSMLQYMGRKRVVSCYAEKCTRAHDALRRAFMPDSKAKAGKAASCRARTRRA